MAHLRTEEIGVVEVRIPPGNKALNVEMADKLVKASWFERIAAPPDKFVVLVDTDGRKAHETLEPFRQQLPDRLGPKITAQIQFACARWHLDAWYFADSVAMREYLGSDLGSVDASQPDAIRNPKLHLENLLGERAYTAVISEEIARRLDARTIGQRSPSFHGFLRAVRNGEPTPPAQAEP